TANRQQRNGASHQDARGSLNCAHRPFSRKGQANRYYPPVLSASRRSRVQANFAAGSDSAAAPFVVGAALSGWAGSSSSSPAGVGGTRPKRSYSTGRTSKLSSVD